MLTADSRAGVVWHEAFRTLDFSFETEHLSPLANHARGKVHAFFVGPTDLSLGHVREIVQRGDFKAECHVAQKTGFNSARLTTATVKELLGKLKESSPEVLVLVSIDCDRGLSWEVVSGLLARVRKGMGLVLMARDPELKDQGTVAGLLEDGGKKFGAGDIDEELMQLEGEEEVAPPPLPSVAFAAPAVQRYVYGKGRVLVLVCPTWNTYRGGDDAILGRDWASIEAGGRRWPIEEFRWRGFEYGYARLAQLVRWAAARESGLTVTGATLDGATGPLRVTITNAADQKVKAKLSWVVRSRRWIARAQGQAEIAVPAGESQHQVEVEAPLPAGLAALEIQLRDAQGRALAFGSAGMAVPGPAITVQPNPRYRLPGHPFPSLAVTVQDADEGGVLETRVIDGYDRVVFARAERVEAGAKETAREYQLEGLRPLTVYHEVTVQLRTGTRPAGRVLAEAGTDLFLLPEELPYNRKFCLGVYGAPAPSALYRQAIVPSTASMGFSLFSHSACDPLVYKYGEGKAESAYWCDRQKSPFCAWDDKEMRQTGVIAEPFLPLFPTAEQQARRGGRLKAEIAREMATGAFSFRIAGERGLAPNFDRSEQTLAGFREWLKKRYADIGELNRVWERDFKSFDDVTPGWQPTGVQVHAPSGNIAPWLEFRLCMSEFIGEYHIRGPHDCAKEVDPRITLGESGVYTPNDHRRAYPVDWSRYAKYYDDIRLYNMYHEGVMGEWFLAFAPGSDFHNWAGYGMREIAPHRRLMPWLQLFGGGRACWYYSMVDLCNYGVITCDGRPFPAYEVLAREEFPDLTGGIDRLLMASKLTDDKIAIAYSWPSILSDWLAMARHPRRVLAALGYQHEWFTMDQIAEGELEKQGYRLLVLSYVSCMSREHAAGIRRFVEQGGTLLAIGHCGFRTVRGSVHKDGSLLDSLLGVETDALKLDQREVEARFRGKALPLTIQDSRAVALNGAERVIQLEEQDGRSSPVLTRARRGKGAAWWMNVWLVHHDPTNKQRRKDGAGLIITGKHRSSWTVFDALLQESGFEPRCRAFDGDAPLYDRTTETWYYTSPSGRTLFVGKYYYLDCQEPLTVRFARSGHIYNMRTHQYHGEASEIRDPFPSGRMKVYALLDYRVDAVEIAVTPQVAEPGGVVTVRCSIQAEAGAPDLHAFRVSVTDPAGKRLPQYDQVVLAKQGTATATLPLALNEVQGEYVVTVKDAISGMEATTRLTVRRKEN